LLYAKDGDLRIGSRKKMVLMNIYAKLQIKKTAYEEHHLYFQNAVKREKLKIESGNVALTY